jgi:hypothetical protein
MSLSDRLILTRLKYDMKSHRTCTDCQSYNSYASLGGTCNLLKKYVGSVALPDTKGACKHFVLHPNKAMEK